MQELETLLTAGIWHLSACCIVDSLWEITYHPQVYKAEIYQFPSFTPPATDVPLHNIHQTFHMSFNEIDLLSK
jgi:hypothetical protein